METTNSLLTEASESAASLTFAFPATAAVFSAYCDQLARSNFQFLHVAIYLAASFADIMLLKKSSGEYSDKVFSELHAWLTRYPEMLVEEVSIAQSGISKAALDSLKRRRFGRNFLIEVRLYKTVFPQPPVVADPIAFNAGNVCYIFLRDLPSDTENAPLFHLYHEIGHASFHTPAYHLIHESQFLSSLVLFIVINAFTRSYWLAIPAFALFCVIRAIAFSRGDLAAREAERGADEFAVFFLKDRIDLCEFAATRKSVHGRDCNMEARNRYLEEVGKGQTQASKPSMPYFSRRVSLPSMIFIVLISSQFDLNANSQVGVSLITFGWIMYFLSRKSANKNLRLHENVEFMISLKVLLAKIASPTGSRS